MNGTARCGEENSKQDNEGAGMMSKVTRFLDMHSGGSAKVYRNGIPQEYIYIEASEEKARKLFEYLFARNPDNITCSCCGEDYSVSEENDIGQATAYERGCEYDDDRRCYTEYARDGVLSRYITVDEYLGRPEVTFIHAHQIPVIED